MIHVYTISCYHPVFASNLTFSSINKTFINFIYFLHRIDLKLKNIFGNDLLFNIINFKFTPNDVRLLLEF